MATKTPPIPKVVPIPKGWRRALARECAPVVLRAAVRALQQALPIGKLQATPINGRTFGFLTEWHYDDHVTAPGKPIWHPGISTIVPIKEPPTVTRQQIDNLIATTMYNRSSKVSGEPVTLEDVMFGADSTEYDAVHGDDFGDEFGVRVRARSKVNIKARGKLKAKIAPKPKQKSKPRPAPRPAPKRPARPAPRSPAKSTPTRSNFPLGTSASRPAYTPPFSTPQAQPQEMAPETDDYAEDMLALDTSEFPTEETPETADEGSDTFDPSAIGYEIGA